MSAKAKAFDLLRKVTPNATYDQEIAATIPAIGTGLIFTDRQVMLLLRLSLKERTRRASGIWDNKGRATKLRKSWYEDLTEQQLSTVGLRLGEASETENGSRRYGDSRPPFNNTNSDVSADADDADDDTVSDSTEEETHETRLSKDHEVAGMGMNRVSKDIKGASKAFSSLFAPGMFSKMNKHRILKMSIGWLHDMDGRTAKGHAGRITYCACKIGGDDLESNSEATHFVDILLDMETLTLGKLLTQLDDALQDSFPDVKWGNLTLCAVELSGWKGSESFKTTLRKRLGTRMSEAQIEEASADLGFMQVFVGYDYVSKGIAQATRNSLKTE